MKKKVTPGLNYRREDWPAEPIPVPSSKPITNEFAKAWEENRARAFYAGWGFGAATGVALTVAAAVALGYIK